MEGASRMPNSFRYLLAVTGLVALLFAAISAWPLFSSWLRSKAAPPVQHPPIVATPVPPQSTGAVAGSSRSKAVRSQVKPLPVSAQNNSQPASQPCAGTSPASSIPPNASNVRNLANNRYIPGSWTTGDGEDSLGWCYALDTITLYNRPDGDPLIPVNLNRCA